MIYVRGSILKVFSKNEKALRKPINATLLQTSRNTVSAALSARILLKKNLKNPFVFINPKKTNNQHVTVGRKSSN